MEMTDLIRLVDTPAISLPYNDPAFPDRPLVLHAAPPRDFETGTPVLVVHHGVRRNGRDYRDYWLDLVDEAGVLAISVEFRVRSFPDHVSYQFGNLHDQEGTPNLREQWTFSVIRCAVLRGEQDEKRASIRMSTVTGGVTTGRA